MSTTKDLLAQFNIVARTEYNRNYQEFEPEFQSLLFEYESGPVETVDFPFFEFLQGMEEFTGSRKHQTFPDGFKFQVTNKEYDMAVDIKRRHLERAARINSLKGLNPYKQRIAEMPRIAKDHPVELAFDMLEVGDGNTLGTTFDGQNLFDTTHDYSTSSGTQNNIVTGTGTTVAQIHADILSVLSRFDSFTYQQGGVTTNAQKRKLNKSMKKLLVVAPTQIGSQFRALMTKDRLANGESNDVKGMFDLVTRPFTDTNDWYMVVLDSPTFRPFLYQVEKVPELDFPTMQDEGARERKIFTWGIYGRYTVAYGAWWTAIQITNT